MHERYLIEKIDQQNKDYKMVGAAFLKGLNWGATLGGYIFLIKSLGENFGWKVLHSLLEFIGKGKSCIPCLHWAPIIESKLFSKVCSGVITIDLLLQDRNWEGFYYTSCIGIKHNHLSSDVLQKPSC